MNEDFPKEHANDNEQVPYQDFIRELTEMLQKAKVKHDEIQSCISRIMYYTNILNDPESNKEGYVFENLDKYINILNYLWQQYKTMGTLNEVLQSDIHKIVNLINKIEMPQKNNVIKIDFDKK